MDMSFRPDKCRRMISNRGKIIKIEWVELLEGNIADVQDSKKYLRIWQANGNNEETTRKSATAIYLCRVRQLNGQNKIEASNTYAQPVIRYPAGIMTWQRRI